MNRILRIAVVFCLGAIAGTETLSAKAQYPQKVNVAPSYNVYQQPYFSQSLYGSGYVPPQTRLVSQFVDETQGGDDVKTLLKQLIETVTKMKEDIAFLRKRIEADDPEPAKGTKDGPPPALISAANKCAKCHLEDLAVKDGDGFVMFSKDGKFAKLGESARKRIIAKVKDGSMPKQQPGHAPDPLTAPEKDAILAAYENPPK